MIPASALAKFTNQIQRLEEHHHSEIQEMERRHQSELEAALGSLNHDDCIERHKQTEEQLLASIAEKDQQLQNWFNGLAEQVRQLYALHIA